MARLPISYCVVHDRPSTVKKKPMVEDLCLPIAYVFIVTDLRHSPLSTLRFST